MNKSKLLADKSVILDITQSKKRFEKIGFQGI